MYFIFPPHITSASVLPEEIRNPEVRLFAVMLHAFSQKNTTVKNITWSELNHPSQSKRSSGSTRQDLGREHSILLCVAKSVTLSVAV